MFANIRKCNKSFRFRSQRSISKHLGSLKYHFHFHNLVIKIGSQRSHDDMFALYLSLADISIMYHSYWILHQCRSMDRCIPTYSIYLMIVLEFCVVLRNLSVHFMIYTVIKVNPATNSELFSLMRNIHGHMHSVRFSFPPIPLFLTQPDALLRWPNLLYLKAEIFFVREIKQMILSEN